jgi:hypothetical protein
MIKLRYYLLGIVSVLSISNFSAVAEDTGTSTVPYVESKDRPGWRNCKKCQVMFNVEGENVCAAGGAHVQAGPQFRLPFGVPETPNAQTKWRMCKNCKAMFYNGYKGKGQCPANETVHNGKKIGGPHVADPEFQYVLPHDVPEKPTTQSQWRFCSKCFALFYNGFPKKGICKAGGEHVAAGYNFVMPHER